MRIAVYSDAHGNSLALDAILADITAAGDIDTHWVIGDVADMGADPAGCVARLRDLQNVTVIRGNADRAVWETTARTELDAIRTAVPDEAYLTLMLLEEGAWTRGALHQAGQLDWLRALPLDHRTVLPDGTRVLLVHARPGHDDGPGPLPDMTDDELRDLLGDPVADLVFVGHTHTALDRTAEGIRVINTGSVSNPPRPDKRATWLLLETDETGYRVERHVAGYDIEAYLASVVAIEHPARERIFAFFDQPLPG